MPTPTSSLFSSISKLLVWAGDITAKDARALAKTNRMKRSIEVTTVQDESATAKSIIVKISTKNAPEALAYEYGSGIWGKEGRKYPINPKNAKFLAFDWPQAANIGSREGVRDVVTPVKMLDGGGYEGGRAILPGVMHPGVRAEPYMQPAADKNLKKILEGMADGTVGPIADMTVDVKVITI